MLLKADTKLDIRFEREETTLKPKMKPTIPPLASPTYTSNVNEMTTAVVSDVKATDWRPYIGIGVLLLFVLLITIAICVFCCYKGYHLLKKYIFIHDIFKM